MPRKNILLISIILTLFLVTVSVDTPSAATGEAAPLCLPGVYNQVNTDCAPVGPTSYLNTMAETGVTFPVDPIPAHQPSFDLTYLDVLYGYVRTSNAPVYPSVADAEKAKRKNAVNYIDSSFSYISYTDESVIDGKRFYMVQSGGWMTANDVSRVSPPTFQGLEFSSTPGKPFGWVLTYLSQTGYAQTKRTPGRTVEDYTEHYLTNHEIVWVYDVQEVDGEEWYKVGPEEWIHQNLIARVVPDTTPPEGMTGNRWIEINLHEQTMAVYENYELVFASLIASGLDPFWTRPGLFQIYEKYEKTPMYGSFEADRSDAYYLEDVPWTLYFDEARAIHGAYWRANLGFPQSHGCVNMSVGDSHWIYDWAEIGDWVYVWDPSGETPIDPDVYGSGGA